MSGRRCTEVATFVLVWLSKGTRAEETGLGSLEQGVVVVEPLSRAAAPAWMALILGLATLFLYTFFFQGSPPALAQRRLTQRRKYEELLRVVLRDVAAKDAEAAATGEEAKSLPEASRIFDLLWDDISEVRTSSYGIDAQGSLIRSAEDLLKRLLAKELGETITRTRDALSHARRAALEAEAGNGDSEEAEYRSGDRLRKKLHFARESVVRRLGTDFAQPAQLRDAEQLLALVARQQRQNLQVLLRLLWSVLAPLFVTVPCRMLAEGLQSVYYQIGRWQRVGDAAVAGDEHQVLYHLLDLALGHLLIWFLEIIADGYMHRATSIFAQNVRTAVMGALVHQDFEYFDKNSAGTLQERLNRDAEELGSNFIQLPQELLAKVACIAFTLFQVALVCPRDMFLLALSPLPLIAYLHHRLEKVRKSTSARGRKLGEDAAAATAEVLKEIRTVRQFANEHRETYLFSQRELLRNRAREGSAMAHGLTGKIFGVIIVSGLLFTEYIGARHVRAGVLTPGLLFDITIKLNFWVVMRVRDLLGMLPRLCTALEPLSRVCELIRAEAKIEDSAALSPLTVPTRAALAQALEKCESIAGPESAACWSSSVGAHSGARRECTVAREELALDGGAVAGRGTVLAAYEVAGEERVVQGKAWLLEQTELSFPLRLLFSDKRIPLRFQGHIEFDRVVFRYPTDLRKEVLAGLSFSVRPREKVALVGEAGCGKSSCMGLLQRLYDPIQGCIRIDGVPLTEYNVNFLRSRVVIVDQKPVLFATSVRENITYGMQREVSDEEVIQVLREASLWAGDNGIESKPDQLLTKLGSGGVALSGGQTQRVSIARAMIRDPDVILLDEATSALDNKNEKIVQEALDRLARRGSALVIAHRLTTIRDADRIIVMRKGKLAEEGTHEELLRMPVVKETVTGCEGEEVVQGIYRHLWELQFRSESNTETETETETESIYRPLSTFPSESAPVSETTSEVQPESEAEDQAPQESEGREEGSKAPRSPGSA